jgi:XTP/dITP diphosphohydrolase
MTLSIMLATRNGGKIREIRAILSGLDVELLDAGDAPPFPEPPEDGETFLANALAKARAVHAATGHAALADDSGIEVDALGGAPGIHSARYGGPGLTDADRCARLLEALANVPDERRTAHFHCVAALYPAPGSIDRTLWTEGFLYGRIARSPRGENGFGYDPVFFLPERGRTVAELAAEEKNAISHRYRAFIEMKYLLARGCGIALRAGAPGSNAG